MKITNFLCFSGVLVGQACFKCCSSKCKLGMKRMQTNSSSLNINSVNCVRVPCPKKKRMAAKQARIFYLAQSWLWSSFQVRMQRSSCSGQYHPALCKLMDGVQIVYSYLVFMCLGKQVVACFCILLILELHVFLCSTII